MIVIARKQKKAIDAAKILIDFTNLGGETERQHSPGLGLGGDQTEREQAVRGEEILIEVEEEIVFKSGGNPGPDGVARSAVNRNQGDQS
mmetsp:Transcript_14446/g.24646  ORF Transcript_14446/g.24646 Transcript_14446/m.24646 type:complete len:89 (+) Transcript_14446:748-1014(+)